LSTELELQGKTKYYARIKSQQEEKQVDNQIFRQFSGSGFYRLYDENGNLVREGYFKNGLIYNGKRIITDEQGIDTVRVLSKWAGLASGNSQGEQAIRPKKFNNVGGWNFCILGAKFGGFKGQILVRLWRLKPGFTKENLGALGKTGGTQMGEDTIFGPAAPTEKGQQICNSVSAHTI